MDNLWAAIRHGADSGILTGGFPYARNQWYVACDGMPKFGKYADTIQQAVNLMLDGDVLHLGYGEFDEIVTVTGLNKITIMGAGNFYGSRVTAVGATHNALNIVGGQDVNLIHLNLEGRTSGSGLNISGQIRRLAVMGCKIHSGTGGCGINLAPAAGGQIVDMIIRDNLIGVGSIASGISHTVGGGDPSHRIIIERNKFIAIVTDCIVSGGAMINTMVLNNYFGNDGDTEPTRFIKLDGASDSGLVAGNQFATPTNAIAKFVLDADVIWGANATEAGWSAARPA